MNVLDEIDVYYDPRSYMSCYENFNSSAALSWQWHMLDFKILNLGLSRKPTQSPCRNNY